LAAAGAALDSEKKIALGELLSYAIISSSALATFCQHYGFPRDELSPTYLADPLM
jgi:hypothetical protein